MTNDNSNTGLGQMLRKAATEKTPPGLDIVIMQKIRAAELRRSYRRMVSAFILRFCTVAFLVTMAGKIFLTHPTPATTTDLAGLLDHIPDNISSVGPWLSGHSYLVIALLIITWLTWRIGRSPDRAL